MTATGTHFAEARVRAIRDVALDVRMLEIEPRSGARPYSTGSHIDIAVEVEGLPDVRSYSLVGERPVEGAYRIAVKQVLDSRGGSQFVRALESGASVEVSEPASHFAGQQETYLWVRGVDHVCDAIRDCWVSLYSTPAISYRLRLGEAAAAPAMGVTVQLMVDADAPQGGRVCAGSGWTWSGAGRGPRGSARRAVPGLEGAIWSSRHGAADRELLRISPGHRVGDRPGGTENCASCSRARLRPCQSARRNQCRQTRSRS